MTKPGERLIGAAKEVAEIARGERDPAGTYRPAAMQFVLRVVRKTEDDDGRQVKLWIGGKEHEVLLGNLSEADFAMFDMQHKCRVSIERVNRAESESPRQILISELKEFGC